MSEQLAREVRDFWLDPGRLNRSATRSAQAVRERFGALLEQAAGVVVMDERKAGGYPTPVGDVAGKDPVFVGRIREDISHDRGLDLWVVSDNIRKGAALNAVQIAELLIEDYL